MTRKELLQLERILGRLDIDETGALLNFQVYETKVLIRLGFLKPLGSPKQNSHRWFAATDVIAWASDPRFLDRCTRALSRHFEEKSKKHRAAKQLKGIAFNDGT